jgi:hypothetical protein
MEGIRQSNMVVFSIMAAITVLNMALVLNFVTASGQALATLFSSESVFLFAAVELAAVLLAYVLHKQKTTQAVS